MLEKFELFFNSYPIIKMDQQMTEFQKYFEEFKYILKIQEYFEHISNYSTELNTSLYFFNNINCFIDICSKCDVYYELWCMYKIFDDYLVFNSSNDIKKQLLREFLKNTIFNNTRDANIYEKFLINLTLNDNSYKLLILLSKLFSFDNNYNMKTYFEIPDKFHYLYKYTNTEYIKITGNENYDNKHLDYLKNQNILGKTYENKDNYTKINYSPNIKRKTKTYLGDFFYKINKSTDEYKHIHLKNDLDKYLKNNNNYTNVINAINLQSNLQSNIDNYLYDKYNYDLSVLLSTDNNGNTFYDSYENIINDINEIEISSPENTEQQNIDTIKNKIEEITEKVNKVKPILDERGDSDDKNKNLLFFYNFISLLNSIDEIDKIDEINNVFNYNDINKDKVKEDKEVLYKYLKFYAPEESKYEDINSSDAFYEDLTHINTDNNFLNIKGWYNSTLNSKGFDNDTSEKQNEEYTIRLLINKIYKSYENLFISNDICKQFLDVNDTNSRDVKYNKKILKISESQIELNKHKLYDLNEISESEKSHSSSEENKDNTEPNNNDINIAIYNNYYSIFNENIDKITDNHIIIDQSSFYHYIFFIYNIENNKSWCKNTIHEFLDNDNYKDCFIEEKKSGGTNKKFCRKKSKRIQLNIIILKKLINSIQTTQKNEINKILSINYINKFFAIIFKYMYMIINNNKNATRFNFDLLIDYTNVDYSLEKLIQHVTTQIYELQQNSKYILNKKDSAKVYFIKKKLSCEYYTINNITTNIENAYSKIKDDNNKIVQKTIFDVIYKFIGKSFETFLNNSSDDKFFQLLNNKLLTKNFKNTIPQEFIQTNYVTDFFVKNYEIIHLFNIAQVEKYLDFLKQKNIYFDDNKIPRNPGDIDSQDNDGMNEVYNDFIYNINELDLNNSTELEKINNYYSKLLFEQFDTNEKISNSKLIILYYNITKFITQYFINNNTIIKINYDYYTDIELKDINYDILSNSTKLKNNMTIDITNKNITINLQLTNKTYIDTLNFLNVNYYINNIDENQINKKIKSDDIYSLKLKNLYNNKNLTNKEKNKNKIYINNIDNNILNIINNDNLYIKLINCNLKSLDRFKNIDIEKFKTANILYVLFDKAYFKIYEKINTDEKYEIFNKIIKSNIDLQNNKITDDNIIKKTLNDIEKNNIKIKEILSNELISINNDNDDSVVLQNKNLFEFLNNYLLKNLNDFFHQKQKYTIHDLNFTNNENNKSETKYTIYNVNYNNYHNKIIFYKSYKDDDIRYKNIQFQYNINAKLDVKTNNYTGNIKTLKNFFDNFEYKCTENCENKAIILDNKLADFYNMLNIKNNKIQSFFKKYDDEQDEQDEQDKQDEQDEQDEQDKQDKQDEQDEQDDNNLIVRKNKYDTKDVNKYNIKNKLYDAINSEKKLEPKLEPKFEPKFEPKYIKGGKTMKAKLYNVSEKQLKKTIKNYKNYKEHKKTIKKLIK